LDPFHDSFNNLCDGPPQPLYPLFHIKSRAYC
jgi:hypothetical protein